MCDYSLSSVASRPAAVGDKLTAHNFGTGTSGFCAEGEPNVAVCVLPGTEIAFEYPIQTSAWSFLVPAGKTYSKVAIFRQINKDKPHAHHDALEMPDGQIIMLTSLVDGQRATVLQLPAAPKTEKEAEDQKRLAVAG